MKIGSKTSGKNELYIRLDKGLWAIDRLLLLSEF